MILCCPAGMRIEYTGENETIMESMEELVKMLLLACFWYT